MIQNLEETLDVGHAVVIRADGVVNIWALADVRSLGRQGGNVLSGLGENGSASFSHSVLSLAKILFALEEMLAKRLAMCDTCF